METLYNVIRDNAQDKGEEKMWQSVSIISNTIEDELSECAKKKLIRKIYALMNDCHYNEHFAKEDVAKMYYVDDNGQKRFGPYVSEERINEVYEEIKNTIPHYNVWDLYVVMNMIISDYHNLIMRWFPEDDMESREKRYVELTLNYLNDEDNPYGYSKIWGYLND